MLADVPKPSSHRQPPGCPASGSQGRKAICLGQLGLAGTPLAVEAIDHTA